ncbi:MAG: hypothetical protein A2073_06970 [Deltaproteobacteria bacterium GWC2_42_11]|nr:MAG: hypothetical protein A2073_06970 [Deltaproteobacteria bacterium GWC2_42_11]HBO83556.1 hypothetical protein [Deltaproteobacteria bacterium]
MSFSTYFTIISYLMAGAGLAASSLTLAVSPLFLAAMAALLIVCFYLHLKGRFLSIPKLLWNIFAVLLLIFFIIDYFFISNLLLESASRFLTIIMAAKLFDLKTNRDYLTLYILVFFQLLAASAATASLSFLFVFMLYIVVGIWALVIFNLKKDWEENAPQEQPMPRSILGPKFFMAAAGLAVLSMFLTAILFFIIPRVGTGFLQRKPGEVIKISGFSDRVDLGDLGPVKLNERVVMRVGLPELDKAPANSIYFRGIAFDNYDGTSWKQTKRDEIFIERNNAGVFTFRGMSDMGYILKQEILLEPIGTDVIFAASFGAAVSGPLPRRIKIDNQGSIYLPLQPHTRIEYTAFSVVSQDYNEMTMPSGSGINAVPERLALYLQVSEGSESIAELAKMVTMGIGDPRLKAIAVQEFLKKNYRYTLNPEKGEGKTPLDDFLFYSKEGYCEHYSTAMAIMLRTLGIPTRLVTGFLKGEWNRFGGYLLVRQRDAHSWVEVYLPVNSSQWGWLTFDPTPSAESAGEVQTPMSVSSLYLDSIRWRWNRYIVHYTLMDQIALARNIDIRFGSVLHNIRGVFNGVKNFRSKLHKTDIAAPISLLVILPFFLFVLWKYFKNKEKTRFKERVPRFYVDMLKLLNKKGIRKPAGKTPLEFAAQLNLKEVRDITDLYLMIRYGKHSICDNETVLVKKSLVSLRKI